MVLLVVFGVLMVAYPIGAWIDFFTDRFIRAYFLECFSGVSTWSDFWYSFSFWSWFAIPGLCLMVGTLLLIFGIRRLRRKKKSGAI